MLKKEDIYFQSGDNPIAVQSVEFESVITPPFPLWVKEVDITMDPCQILSLKCYKVIVNNNLSYFVNVAQYINKDNQLEQYWIDKECFELMFDGMPEGEFITVLPTKKTKNNRSSLNLATEWHEPLKGDVLTPDFENADESSPFYMKKVVVTGVFKNFERDDLGQILKEKGADIDRSITKKTDFVLVGDKAGPAKLKKIVDLQSKGSTIKIIEEEELLVMLVENEN